MSTTLAFPTPTAPQQSAAAAAAEGPDDARARGQLGLEIRGLGKRFGGVTALEAVDLRIAAGELIALVGPSGSGKTTLLRAIAGLLPADAGEIRFGDRDATALSLRERNVGFVFQHYALFRHMTVAENVAFGLRSRPRARRPDRAAIAARVDELLRLVQLPDYGARYPDQLSGGQKQRIALARALAIEPSVLLLDEPFGALDAKVRVELRRWLRTLHEQAGRTTVFVTHDQEEALELADRVVILRGGRIEQVGTPDEIYREPRSAYVFDFIGRSNRLDGRIEDGAFVADGLRLDMPAGTRAAASGTEQPGTEHPGNEQPGVAPASGPAQLYVRPHDVALSADGHGDDAGDRIAATVLAVRRRADRITLELALQRHEARWELDLVDHAEHCPVAGTAVRLHLRRWRAYPRSD